MLWTCFQIEGVCGQRNGSVPPHPVCGSCPAMRYLSLPPPRSLGFYHLDGLRLSEPIIHIVKIQGMPITSHHKNYFDQSSMLIHMPWITIYLNDLIFTLKL